MGPMDENPIQARLEELAADRVSGAREIVARLLNLLHERLPELPAEEARRFILQAARAIVPRQPTMAPLLFTFNQLFRHAEEDGGLVAVLEDLRRRHHEALDHVVRTARPLLEGVRGVAILSWSSTVNRVLEGMAESCRVFVAESRPGCEGRRAAVRAAAAGHRVVFHPDAAFPGAAAEAELLLLGGDALTSTALINKVGSLPAAREFQSRGAKVVALVDAFKVIDEGLAERLRILPENPAEVWEGAPEGVEVSCRYFEAVPVSLLDQVWSEDGARDPQDLFTTATTDALSPLWREVPLPAEGEPIAV